MSRKTALRLTLAIAAATAATLAGCSPKPHSDSYVTLGKGRFTAVLLRDGDRKAWRIQNPVEAVEPVDVYLGPAAKGTHEAAFELAPGAMMACAAVNCAIPGGEVAVASAKSGHRIVVSYDE